MLLLWLVVGSYAERSLISMIGRAPVVGVILSDPAQGTCVANECTPRLTTQPLVA